MIDESPSSVASLASADRRGAGFAAVVRPHGTLQLLAGAFVGRMPQGMLSLAALLLVRADYHSFAVAGVATGAVAFGIAIAAPLQGSLVDRLGPRRVLVPVAVGQAAATAGVALEAGAHIPAAALVLLCALAGMLVPPISATLRSVWVRSIPGTALRHTAFALDAMTTQLVFALGPMLASAIVAAATPAAAVVASGLLTLAGTLAFVTAPPLGALRTRGDAARAHDSGRRWSARRTALASPALRAALLTVLCAGFGTGIMEVGLPALSVQLGARATSGVLLGLWAIGAALGGWWYGHSGSGVPSEVRQRQAALAAAALALPLLLAQSIPAALGLALLAGLPWAALSAAQYGRVGEAAPEHALTEAFTWSVAALVAGVGIGSTVGGAIAAATSARWCFPAGAAAVALIPIVARLAPTREASAP